MAQQAVASVIMADRNGRFGGPVSHWIHSPELAEQYNLLWRLVEHQGGIPPRWMEIALLATTAHYSAEYPWTRHASNAAGHGVPAEVISAIGDRRPPPFDDDTDELIWRVAQNVLATGGLENSLYRETVEYIGLANLVEVVLVVGYGCRLSYTTLTCEPSDSNPEAPPLRLLPTPNLTPLSIKKPRLPAISASSQTTEQRNCFQMIPENAPSDLRRAMEIWLNCPSIAAHFIPHYTALQKSDLIPVGLRELVATQTGDHWGCDLVMRAHAKQAQNEGIPHAAIMGVLANETPTSIRDTWSVSLEFCRALHRHGCADDDIQSAVVEAFGYRGVIELMAIAVMYTLISLQINVFGQ